MNDPGYNGLVSVTELDDLKIAFGAASYPRLQLGTENVLQEALSIILYVCCFLGKNRSLPSPTKPATMW